MTEQAEPAAQDPAKATTHDGKAYQDSPELTKGQNDMLRQGKLPGELKLQAITFFTAVIALVVAIVALIN